MGVLNITPDSFSDGGRFLDPARAAAHALEMEAAGASIIDVGGESTRPGAHAVAPEIEMARIIPILQKLAGNPGFRLAAPKLYRSAKDLDRWIGALEGASQIEAADSVDGEVEELRVRVR